MKLLLCLIAAASCLVAQNEAALRQALEDKQVTATWRQPGKVTEVRFVNGVAVKVSTSTK